MIRSDLVLRLAALNPHLYEKDCEAVVDAILGRIADALVSGDRVEIRGFGSFTVKEQRARQGRNPRNGVPVAVPAKTVLAFKAGKEMRARVNPKAARESIGQQFSG
ncbi:integration host factor subunit beta [Methylobacterium sp. WL30]|uniref:HU family DNA-binding protein n=1 Tax=unclassified Methylobacterium TaxID=2615210 RepID=UPI0011CBF7EB|nr:MULTISPECIES: HU family DNA-binding protein [unclassified Methylobacterium]TXN41555.1 integration host factor subunit beta [Methylobacterium sp. WL93]TXN52436.1 integration host factor subunit beta [Methylobacterium sp. WL119]TXN69759.1 integration host factor subunit beta [Methylobacterium sp. WL30]